MEPNFYYPVTLRDEESCKGCDFLAEGVDDYYPCSVEHILIRNAKRPESCPLIPMGFIRAPEGT